jgi:putative spermidine/putrescine transport system ATP-binding protein
MNEPTATATLEVDALHKEFGRHRVVDDVSFRTTDAEFLTLLGPSGSGKTTTLRMIAGFTQPTSGTIRLLDRDVTTLPPERRDIGMVFQSYALFPHLSAARNIAFPLEMRKEPRAEIERRVAEALRLVRLEGLGDRLPRQLSGGQQQRIALARAVVYRPRLLLMDEPLGALDRKLREALQVEILRIRRELGVTVVYVTHDQDEALSMSDRIAVFNDGRIEQIGTARQLYERPATRFVAEFLGDASIVAGTVAAGGTALDVAEGSEVPIPDGVERPTPGTTAALVVRAEAARLQDAPPAATEGGVNVVIEEVLYLGASSKVVVRLPDGSRGAVVRPGSSDEGAPGPGDSRWMTWDARDAVLVPDGPVARSFGEKTATEEDR